jgi:hypothetical protein
MDRPEAMEDQDNGTEIEEDDLISLLHLDNGEGLNRCVKYLLLDYNSLLEYVYWDIIPEGIDNITRNNGSETEEDW